jgi:hypothetical protein
MILGLQDYGVDEFCPYEGSLQQAILPATEQPLSQERAEAGLAFANALAHELRANPCDYVKTGQCRAAEFAIKLAAETPVVITQL